MIFENFINLIDNKFHHKRISKFLKKYKIELILDIGSHKGEFIRNISVYIPYIKAYTFEPQKDIFEILKNNLKNDKRIINNNLAISDTNGVKKIFINNLTSTSSLSEINTNSFFFKIKNYLLNKANENKFYDIEAITIDNYFKDQKFENSLLKIDVEGHELNVLIGAKNSIQKINFILIENQFFDLYKQNDFNKCHEFLIRNNYKLVKKFLFPTLHFEDRLYQNNNFNFY